MDRTTISPLFKPIWMWMGTSEDLEVRMVPEMGWAGIKNEALLQMSEEHFDVLHTSDRNLVFQQNMSIVHLDILSDACTEQ
jgi:hypothetical protein